jgi:hypothetical protein
LTALYYALLAWRLAAWNNPLLGQMQVGVQRLYCALCLLCVHELCVYYRLCVCVCVCAVCAHVRHTVQWDSRSSLPLCLVTRGNGLASAMWEGTVESQDVPPLATQWKQTWKGCPFLFLPFSLPICLQWDAGWPMLPL